MTSYLFSSLLLLFVIFVTGNGSVDSKSNQILMREKRAFSLDDFVDDALDTLSDAIDEGVDNILGDLGLDNKTIGDVKDAVDDVVGLLDNFDSPTSAEDSTSSAENDESSNNLDDLINSLTEETLDLNELFDLIENAVGNNTFDDIDAVFDDVINQLSNYLQDGSDIDRVLESTTLSDVGEALNRLLSLADAPVEIPELPEAVGDVLADLTINEVLTVVGDIFESLLLPNEGSRPVVGTNGTNSDNIYRITKLVQSVQKINQAIKNVTLPRMMKALRMNGVNVTSISDRNVIGLVSAAVQMVRSELAEIRKTIMSELGPFLSTTTSTTTKITTIKTTKATTVQEVTTTSTILPSTTKSFPVPENGRLMALLASRVQDLSSAIQSFTRNGLTTSFNELGINTTLVEGSILNGVIPDIINVVQNRLQETRGLFESMLQGMLSNTISIIRSSDNVFVKNVFQNKTDQEITEILTKNLQDLIPLLMKVASNEATLIDVKCVLVDQALIIQLNDTFQNEQTAKIVSSLLLTLTGCDAQLSAAGNVLTNYSQLNTGVQAMTSLTSITELTNAEPVAIIQNALSSLSTPLAEPTVFNERLSTLLLLLNNLISQATRTATTTVPPTSATPSRNRLSLEGVNGLDLSSTLRSVLNLANGQGGNSVEQILTNVLSSALASTSISDTQPQVIGNRLASALAPLITTLVNSTLSNYPSQLQQLQALSSLLERIDLDDPLSLVNVLSELSGTNGSFTNLLPPSVSQFFGQGSSGLPSLASLSAIPRAMMALGQIYSDGYNTSGRCQLERSAVGRALMSMEPWALYFVDSAGKLGTGVLQGNTYMVGNFDECEAISGTTAQGDVIQGSYVKYKFQMPLPPGVPSMNGLITYQESGLPILIWGACLPKGCSQQDAKVIGDGVAAGLNVAPVSAEIITARDPLGDSVFVVAMFIFGILGLLCLIGTFIDVIIKNQLSQDDKTPPNRRSSGSRLPTSNMSEEPMAFRSPTGERVTNPSTFRDLRIQLGTVEANAAKGQRDASGSSSLGALAKIFQAFSVYTNAPDILSARQSPAEISCLHGIRVLSITWVILGHAYFFYPQFGNLTTFAEMSKWWTFHGILNAPLAVDSFFVLSGCLVAYLFLRSVKKAGGLQARHMVLYYTHRYLRLTPLYAVAILFYTGVTPYMEHGPFQQQITDRDVYCRDNWYWNLLYISNLRDDADICVGWSWYLPNDMQFYFIAPLILIPLALGYKVVGLLVAFLQFACHVVVFTILEGKYNGSPTRNSYDYFVNIYIKPYTRCGPYAVGLALGYLLYKTKCKVSLHRFAVILGWTLAIGAGLTTVYITVDNYNSDLGALDLQWSKDVMNAYEIASKPVWSLCLAWLIFACATGYGGIINSILSWKAWVPLSRLTYGVYLVHVMVMHYFNNNRRTLAYLTKEYVIERFLAVIVMSYGMSFVLSLLVETPVRNLTKPKPVDKTPSAHASKRRPSTTPSTGSARHSKMVTFSSDVNFISNDYNSLPHTPKNIHPSAPEPDETFSPAFQTTETATTGPPVTARHGMHVSQETNSSNVLAQAPSPKEKENHPSAYPNLAYVMNEGDWLSTALGQHQENESEDQPSTSTAAQATS